MTPTPQGGALACANPSYDFGKPVQGPKLVHSFKLQNTGSRPLRVLSVGKSYSCEAAAPAATIAAGEEIELRIECTTQGRSGKMADEVRVHTDAPTHADVTLTLVAEIEPLLAFEAEDASFELSFGEQREREIRLRGSLARQARLSEISREPGAPTVEILPGEDGVPAGVRLRARGELVGQQVGQLRFGTGLAEPAALSLVYSLRVTGNLTVNPTNPYFNLREPPPRERVVTVSSSRPDFVLHAAEISEGPFSASVTQDEASKSYLVRVRFLDAQQPSTERGALGKLIIASNDPAEPRKVVPLFALGVRSR